MALSQESRASAVILLAGVGWGFLGLFFNILSKVGFTPVQVSFVRMGGGWIFLALYVGFFRRDLLGIRSWKDALLFVAIGMGSLNFTNICLFSTMQVSSVAVAAVLMYTAPIFVLGMSVVFFKEQLTIRKIISIALSVAGCALVSGIVGASGGGISLLAFGLGMCTAICYASYSILGRLAVEKYAPLTMTFYSFLFCALGMLPFARVSSLVTIEFTWPIALSILALGTISAAIPYLLYSIGLRHVEPSKAAVLATIEPIVAALISFFVLHEYMSVWQMMGIGCILTGVVLLSMGVPQGGTPRPLKE